MYSKINKYKIPYFLLSAKVDTLLREQYLKKFKSSPKTLKFLWKIRYAQMMRSLMKLSYKQIVALCLYNSDIEINTLSLKKYKKSVKDLNNNQLIILIIQFVYKNRNNSLLYKSLLKEYNLKDFPES